MTMTLVNVSHWAEKLEPSGKPLFLNYIQKFGYTIDDPYHGAIIGWTSPSHPVIGRLLRWPARALFGLSRAALGLAGYKESEDWDEENRFRPTDGGFDGWGRQIVALRKQCLHVDPIYDQAKVEENRRRIAEKRAAQPKIYWGQSRIAKQLEEELLTGKSEGEG